ncbi:pyridoxamine 5'-phosphate oxidase-domain-containing protein [Chaetomium sp. MPI-SDFR-AT-0129]|nr:pyridoxamine 5'-phosphate oxidase-domain-containing protein [Chaetomium sp. MPI-SDFR-AT-0129]
MKPVTIASALLSCCATTSAAAIAIASPNPRETRIPTSYESAVLGRRILALTPLGTLSTVFPDDKNKREHSAAEDADAGTNTDDATTRERRPQGLGGLPYGLMEYIADCEEDDDVGNPTILAISIGTTFKNVAAGSNVSLAVQWAPPYPPAKRIKSWAWASSYLNLFRWWNGNGGDGHGDGGGDSDGHDIGLPYSAANLPRFSLLGHLEPIEGSDDPNSGIGAQIAKCYVDSHPDAKYWLPGNRIHEAHFVRLVVEQVYWVGGFGDRAFIGWIPVEEWQNVTRREWEKVRLPGEKKGWKEWSIQGDL